MGSDITSNTEASSASKRLKFITDYRMDALLDRLNGNRRVDGARELFIRLGQRCLDNLVIDGRVYPGDIRACRDNKDRRTIDAYMEMLVECGVLVPLRAVSGAFRITAFEARYHHVLRRKMRALPKKKAAIFSTSEPEMSPIQSLEKQDCKTQETAALPQPEITLPPAPPPTPAPVSATPSPKAEDQGGFDPELAAVIERAQAAQRARQEALAEVERVEEPATQEATLPVAPEEPIVEFEEEAALVEKAEKIRTLFPMTQIAEAVRPLANQGFDVNLIAVRRATQHWPDLNAAMGVVMKKMELGKPIQNPGGYLLGTIRRMAQQRSLQ